MWTEYDSWSVSSVFTYPQFSVVADIKTAITKSMKTARRANVMYLTLLGMQYDMGMLRLVDILQCAKQSQNII